MKVHTRLDQHPAVLLADHSVDHVFVLALRLARNNSDDGTFPALCLTPKALRARFNILPDLLDSYLERGIAGVLAVVDGRSLVTVEDGTARIGGWADDYDRRKPGPEEKPRRKSGAERQAAYKRRLRERDAGDAPGDAPGDAGDAPGDAGDAPGDAGDAPGDAPGDAVERLETAPQATSSRSGDAGDAGDAIEVEVEVEVEKKNRNNTHTARVCGPPRERRVASPAQMAAAEPIATAGQPPLSTPLSRVCDAFLSIQLRPRLQLSPQETEALRKLLAQKGEAEVLAAIDRVPVEFDRRNVRQVEWVLNPKAPPTRAAPRRDGQPLQFNSVYAEALKNCPRDEDLEEEERHGA